MKTIEAMGLFAWVFGAMLLVVAGLAVWIAMLRARGPWSPLEQRLAVALALLAGAFPLVGLLGTVINLGHSFEAVHGVDPAHKADSLSAGISGAMNCTAAGLGLLLPVGAIAVAALVSGSRRAPKKQSGPASG